jgi:hypothetical protein
VRQDMFEVIIERPRWGHQGMKRKGRRSERTARAFERAPKRLGMGRAGKTKHLNENLAPLRRFLRSNVGRPWQKVRSEMSAVLSMSSAVQKHVMDHVKDFVEEHPVMIDGVPHRPNAWGGQYQPLYHWRRWSQFYVCPETGLLRAAERPRKKRAAAQSVMDARPALRQ